MSTIVSRQNPKFKLWLSLCESRGIKKSGLALLSGRKLVSEFLSQRPQAAVEILSPDGEPAPVKGVRTYALSASLFRELDVLGTGAPLLVIRVQEPKVWQPEKPSGLELIVPVSDPGNLGALLRSSEAFKVRRVILTREACSPFLPKALRAASGATFRLNIEQTGPLAEVLATPSYCLDMQGESLSTFKWPADLYLYVGEEGRGLPAQITARPLAIPMSGQLESLNVMAAASIAMFSYRNQWPAQ